MKNYNEMANDVLRRIGEHETLKRNRINVAKKVVIPACCFCLVALIGIGVWQDGAFKKKPSVQIGDSTIVGEKDSTNDKGGAGSDEQVDGDFTPNGQKPPPKDSTGTTSSVTSNVPNNYSSALGGASSEQNDPNRVMFIINTVKNSVSAAKLKFSEDKYYSEKKTLSDITAYLGKDLSNLNDILPKNFEFTGGYETNFYYELSGKLAYDTCAFNYKKDEQQIRIVVSKIGTPYDCIYMLENPTISKINGEDVTIGGIFKDDKSEDYKFVFADFSHNGLNFRVTAENVLKENGKDMLICLYNIVCELTK